MSYLLSDPDMVLVVGSEPTVRDAATAAVLAGDASDALAVESVVALSEPLAARDDVGCVVVLDGHALSDALATVRDADYGGRLPVVAYVAADEGVAETAATRAGCRYLPRSAGDAALRAAVDDALAAYDRERREAAESSLFTTLLRDGDFSLFAKDDAGRFLYKADVDGEPDPADAIGKTDADIAAEEITDTAQLAYEDDLAVAETGEPLYRQVESYEYTTGHTEWVEVTKIPWRVGGEIRGLVGYSKDVNRRKRLEERLEDQSRRIDQFVSYVTHDLRTPLQIIYGSLDRARAGDDRALDRVEEATERIETIVDDLGDLTRGESASPLSSDALRSVDAAALTTDLVPMVEELWSVVAPPDAELRVDLPDETVVGAEAETVRPVFENLLKNAVDHAGPDVTVRVGATETNCLFVEDDGPGIPPGERERVTDVGYTTADDGTGTGLDIVVQTLSRRGWGLEIADAAIGGARFEIEGLPLVTRTTSDASPAAEIPLTDNEDVGAVDVPGSAEYDPDADSWTVVADGENIWGDVHEFHAVHGAGTPPVRIEGRIVDFDGVEEYSKAGFAVRAGMDERDPFGYVGATESHGSEVTWRESRDGFTDSEQFEELPGTFAWYRVDYVDGVVTCYVSEAGEEWHPVSQQAIDLGDAVSVGMMVCSHSTRQTCEATFGDVRAVELDVE